jgi:hypothetical protein
VIQMTIGEPKSFVPPWKLVETIATIGFAILARGTVNLLDDRASIVRRWVSSFSPAERVLVRARSTPRRSR